MDAEWVIFANSSIAYVYTVSSKNSIHSIKLITKLEHPASRKKRQELVSDRPGHYQTRGPARGAYSRHTDLKEVETDQFAKEITNLLEKNRTAKKYKHLILVVAPHFYGLLMKHFSKALHKQIKKVFEKEIIINSEYEAKKYIDTILHT